MARPRLRGFLAAGATAPASAVSLDSSKQQNSSIPLNASFSMAAVGYIFYFIQRRQIVEGLVMILYVNTNITTYGIES